MAVAGRARIPREELVERVRAGLDAGSVLLVAGAGFGKTTILERALEGRHAVWVSCAESDAHKGHLLSKLMDGLRAAVPGAIDVLAERVTGSRRAIDTREVLGELASELRQLLLDPLTIVVDDAERLADSDEALALLEDLIAIDAGPVSIAVASRTPLRLRVAKLASAGRLVELGPRDLAFSPEECAALLDLQDGRAHGQDEVEALFDATEGWPLGVALGAATQRAGEAIGPTSATTLMAFLDEEVLDRLPPDIRTAVVDSSIVEELSPACAQAIGLPPDFQRRVAGSGVPLRVDNGTFAFHPLVRELLRARLEAERPRARRDELHTAVAPALQSDGHPDEAIEHWLRAEAWPEAATAIAARGQALAPTAPATVKGWLDTLPRQHGSAPACLLLRGTLEWAAGNNARAIELLRQAVDGYRAQGDAEGEWVARFALADPLSIVGLWDESIALAEGYEDAPEGIARAIAAIVLAYATTALGATGRVEECERMSDRLCNHPGAGRRLRSARPVWVVYARSLSGDLDEEIRLFERKLEEVDITDFMSRRPLAATGLALCLGDQGRDDRALEAWRRAAESARAHHVAFLVDWSHAWCALILAREGRLAEAQAELADAQLDRIEGWRAYTVELARARIAALAGDWPGVVAAAERAVVTAQPAPLPDRFRTTTEVAPLLAEAGQPRRAGELLDDAIALCDERVPGESGDYWRAILLATRAGQRLGQGDEGAALDDARAAWRAAGSHAADLVRHRRHSVHPVLWLALEHDVLDARDVVTATGAASEDGDELLHLTTHPSPATREAGLRAIAASGHPAAARRLTELAGDPDPGVQAAAAHAAATLTRTPPALAFRLLGGFEVHRGRHRVTAAAWERRVAERLVRLLLVHGGRVPEDVVLDAFWPDTPPKQARRSLQVAISCARSVLDTPGQESVIEVAEQTLGLRLGPRDTLDTDRFEEAAATALSARGDERRRLLEQAVKGWTGEPLPEERYADWTAQWRERLTQRFGEVLSALAGACRDAGDKPATILAARRLVDLDPLDEGAQRELITAYARAGRRAPALRQYLACRRALFDDLGLEPSAETADLQRRVLAGERL